MADPNTSKITVSGVNLTRARSMSIAWMDITNLKLLLTIA